MVHLKCRSAAELEGVIILDAVVREVYSESILIDQFSAVNVSWKWAAASKASEFLICLP
jgi:hypothetical protein